MQQATLIGTLTALPSGETAELAEIPPGVSWLEVRADLTGDLDPAVLRRRFPGRLLYTLRSQAEGGSGPDGEEPRCARLAAAAAGYDLVDLEAERDLTAELLAAVPPERRLLSWHGPAVSFSELSARFAAMAPTPAAWYKLVPAARQPGQELAPLQLLASLRRRDVVAFASGLQGTWTRLLAPRLGAPLVYGALGDPPGAPGQLSIARLIRDYGLPELRPVAAVCGIVGKPVSHSLSPRLHNAAYRELDLPALYLPFETDSFGDFWLEVVESDVLGDLGFPLRGLSVTAPYKAVALAVAGASSPLAERVGAANTLVCSAGVWEAETTDPAGVLGPLRARGVELAGRRAAVLGCGGAGRAAAVGLEMAGARVTLFNRSEARGLQAAAQLGMPFRPFEQLEPERFDLIVNATALGRSPQEPLPVAVDQLAAGTAVVDLVYHEPATPLVELCRRRGLPVVEGREVLLCQAVDQFRLMTGREMPLATARGALGLEP